MDHNKKYNKQIELFYDYDDYQVDIYSVLDSIKEFKSTGICINRTNFIVSYHKIYDFNKVDVPIQIFSGSPKSYHRKSLNINEITNLNLLKETHNIILFIHSIYIINLSREINDNKLIINYLQKEFEIGKSMNSKGIVFHVGKQVNLSKELALNTMKSNILDILDLATENTPFILETPAGQGTELLTTYQEFSDFYSDIMSYNIAKNRFKICIDSLKIKESICTIQVSDFIIKHHLTKRLFITQNHLTNFFYIWIVKSIFEFLENNYNLKYTYKFNETDDNNIESNCVFDKYNLKEYNFNYSILNSDDKTKEKIKLFYKNFINEIDNINIEELDFYEIKNNEPEKFINHNL